jgi:UDP-N-acetylmuramate dehydrogenase
MIDIQTNVDLKPYNTFGIRAKARHFVSIRSTEDLRQLIQTDLFKNEKRLILGGGSNILLTGDFEGLVVHNDLRGIKVSHESDDFITLSVGSGEPWHPFVLHCVNHDWGGIENLALIPGTVGAAPMQNIGAYGVELKEVVEQVSGVDLATGEDRVFTNAQCQFGYRESIFKHDLKEKIFISSVTLRLSRKNHTIRTEYGAIQEVLRSMNATPATIRSVCEAVIRIRQQKLPDPNVLGNSGSFFKNPAVPSVLYDDLKNSHQEIPGYPTVDQHVKIPAAWLIEQCGWKGKKINHAGVHHQQALVLVNYGEATGAEILGLANQIQADVQQKFGIVLTPEVNII